MEVWCRGSVSKQKQRCMTKDRLPWAAISSQRSLHSVPIFRLLLKERGLLLHRATLGTLVLRFRSTRSDRGTALGCREWDASMWLSEFLRSFMLQAPLAGFWAQEVDGTRSLLLCVCLEHCRPGCNWQSQSHGGFPSSCLASGAAAPSGRHLGLADGSCVDQWCPVTCLSPASHYFSKIILISKNVLASWPTHRLHFWFLPWRNGV